MENKRVQLYRGGGNQSFQAVQIKNFSAFRPAEAGGGLEASDAC